MTSPVDDPATWHRHLRPWRQRRFEAMGWTGPDWLGLYAEFSDTDQEWGIREWLCGYWPQFEVPVTPADVRAAHAAHGDLAVDALHAYADGASERFVTAFIQHACGGDVHAAGYPAAGWAIAQECHLNEPDATGWAITGQLGEHNARRGPRQIQEWTQACGTGAYLWVLAGFTLEEVQAMPVNGRQVTSGQLRVMVALHGAVLPDGL